MGGRYDISYIDQVAFGGYVCVCDDVCRAQAVEDNPLTKELAGECLSLLCKTGDGLAHAYVRMDVRDKLVNKNR